MNLFTGVARMPSEIQYYIRGYIPQKRCIICNSKVIEFTGTPDIYICSINCLTTFNTSMMKRIKYNNIVITTMNVTMFVHYGIAVLYVTTITVTGIICPFFLSVYVIYNICRVSLILTIGLLFTN